MLILKIDVAQADEWVKLPNIPTQVGSHTINKKLLLCKHTYDRKGFPYENTAENVFII